MTTIDETAPPAPASTVSITHEPLTYRQDVRVSYFRDVVLAAREDAAAQARLDQHASEMRTVLAARDANARAVAATQGIELRANPNRLDGQGGYASGPLWLMDFAATAPRPGRPLAELMPTFTLPAGVSEVNLPRLSTGTQVGVTADGAPVPGRDIVDAAVTSPVVALSGQSDAALQVLEQSPGGAFLDAIIFRDLAADYDLKLEQQLINGTGVGGQLLGVLNVPTGTGLANAITYTDGSPTALEMVPFIGQAAAQVGNTRGLGPEAWLLRTSRRAWVNAAAWPSPGHWFGYPPVEDNAIPATLGGSPGTQDAIIACRPSDMLLLESVPRFRVEFESLSGVLEARLQMHGYTAALTARQPTGIATVTGTGMAVQSGWS